MSAVFAAASLGMKTIVIVDLVQDRLELAKQLGATHSVNGREVNLVQMLNTITDGGADYSVEATGAAPCVKAAWDCLGPLGKLAQLGT